MTSSSAPARAVPPAAPPGRIALELVAALVVAVAVNVVIQFLGGLILGRSSSYTIPVLYTVVGVLVGVVGWVVVRQLVPRPAAVLRVLVPLVVILSFIPDLFLFGLLPVVRVLVLMLMHLGVAVPTVIALRRVLPV